ncbi:lasso RiPP family leader peptide-containing protein [Pseudaestuariivita rosea]|uniref:lasso RiPP family leader peptide-containing protein n=1 Tax=Pseudaestuariivita rosea TaxID=2763263 RepID=UPI001F44EC50|nr:lasso RiPP family leader peptide-containing protein [Pseudaestuariivita rosea]
MVQMKADKRDYEAPKLVAHGSIEKITHGGSHGGVTDANFTRGTPIDDITFS